MAPDDLPDPIAVAVHFTGLLDELGIRHLIGGSLASSIHGEPRSTNDIDVLAELRPVHVAPLLEALGPAYVVARAGVEDAVGAEGSFNAIHRSGAVKVDVFIAGSDPFDQERLARREHLRIDPSSDARVALDTAEHSALRKLEWYRRGGQVSDRQWRDVVAILRAQGPGLDRERMDAWADHLGVVDLLARAREEAGAP